MTTATTRGDDERLLVVSADTHAGGDPEAYRRHMDPKFQDAIDELVEESERFRTLSEPMRFSAETLAAIDGRGALASGGEHGAWDFERRLTELDAEGVAAELVFPGQQFASLPFFSTANAVYPPELRAAGARAYHRWLADRMADADGRLYGVGDPGPCLDLDTTVRELQWLADHGFVSVGVPGTVADPALPPLFDPYYERLWAACADLGLVLSIHAGWGQRQGLMFKFLERMSALGELDADNLDAVASRRRVMKNSPLVLGVEPGRALWQLMLGGVFDRHPTLRIVVTEIRADWVPATFAYLDERFAKSAPTLALKPSEYWQRNCWVTPSAIHKAEVALRHEIGVNRLMFGTDYPHMEGTWPNTRDWIRDAFTGVPDDEVAMILGGNAIACYGLDPAHLESVAARVGPRASAADVDVAAIEPIVTTDLVGSLARPEPPP
jgi:predicted TIM-barrel fold metal-dependent hydrolase